MVKLIPFKGLRYNNKAINLENVVAPPYDVITKEQQSEYYNKTEFNVIRLILGKSHADDTSNNNRYTRASSYLEKWLMNGVLIQDGEPSIYVYEGEYQFQNETKIFKGFIALALIDEVEGSSILPHEETLDEQIKDRLALISKCKSNFSSIYSIYQDSSNDIDSLIDHKNNGELISDVVAEQVHHRMWKISNPQIINRIVKSMENKQVVIADGHHRYKTAREFWIKSKDDTSKYVMMFFANIDYGGITILPAHRVIKDIKNINLKNILPRIEEHFDIIDLSKGKSKIDITIEMEKFSKNIPDKKILGLYYQNKFFLLVLKNYNVLDDIGNKDKSKRWRRLDVSTVHYLILKHILNINKIQNKVEYIIDCEDAISLVDKNNYQLAIFVKPTKLKDVIDIAKKGEKMPGKATYFYPKLLTGLVLNKFL
ncbi:MAG: hypothetical protein CMN79_04910 [Spirochaetales bacterium]|nr:hypothetical protein [Spirochaetales bacterium]|tara:strand:- start:1120 stop:2397 length:1278 start_codon:yes stop_codon:yes gene_type:complete